MDKELLLVYLRRFLRTVVPQIPAIIAFTSGWKYAPAISLIGALITTLDKWLRDNSEGYSTASSKIGL